MKKVNVTYKEKTIIVPGNEIKKGIHVYNNDDIVISDSTVEKISSLLEKYNTDDSINLEMIFTDFLDNNEIEWEHICEGYYTEKELIEKYEDYILIDTVADEAYKAKEYYNGYEEFYYYDHWDGSNWETIELENEGQSVVFITTVEEKNTYTIDLYYNIEEKEAFTVLNSFYQGTLLTHIITEAIEDEGKVIIEDIENLLEKINYEIEHNNKCADKHEGFTIAINVSDKELETFSNICSLYDWFEYEENKLYITTQY